MPATKTKTEGGEQFGKSAYLINSSDNPSDWKIRIEESPGKVTVAQLGAAAAALSSGGFRGNPVQASAEEKARAKAKLRAAYARLGAEPPAHIKESYEDDVLAEALDVLNDLEERGARHSAADAETLRTIRKHINQLLGEDDDEPKPAQEAELGGEFVALEERAVGTDGTIGIRIIAPGKGSSGEYTKEVLERDGPKAWPRGTKMYWNHPTKAEESSRPERDLRDLAAETTTDPVWREDGSKGPGLYARAKVFEHYRPHVEALAGHIGVSIRGDGKINAKTGVVEAITKGKSIDFVTVPGAGGQIVSLFEAARTPTKQGKDDDAMGEAELAEVRKELAESRQEMARLREREVLRDARDFAVARLTTTKLPDITKNRLAESLGTKPVLTDKGELDREAFGKAIDEAVKAETEYITNLLPASVVTGMGIRSVAEGGDKKDDEKPGDKGDKFVESLSESFQVFGFDEKTAKLAAAGRGQ